MGGGPGYGVMVGMGCRGAGTGFWGGGGVIVQIKQCASFTMILWGASTPVNMYDFDMTNMKPRLNI